MLGQEHAGNYHEDYSPSPSYWYPVAPITVVSAVSITDRAIYPTLGWNTFAK